MSKRSLWDRVWTLKVANLLWVLLALGAILIVLDPWTQEAKGSWRWVKSVPWNVLGGAALEGAFLGFVFEVFAKREALAATTDAIGVQLVPVSNAVRQAVREAAQIAATTRLSDRKTLDQTLSHLSDDALEDLVVAVLSARLKDEEIARDATATVLEQVASYPERHEGYRLTASLAVPERTGDELACAEFYDAFVEISYITSNLRTDVLRFVRVSSIEEYNRLLMDPTLEFRWIEEDSKRNQLEDPRGLSLEYAYVGDIELTPREIATPNRRLIVAEDPEGRAATLVGRRAEVRYKYRVRVQRRGHSLFFNVRCPTHGVSIELDYARTDIRHVNVSDFFDSPTRPSILRMPNPANCHRIKVELPEWVFPKSGVVFGWVLEAEMNDEFLRSLMPRAVYEADAPDA